MERRAVLGSAVDTYEEGGNSVEGGERLKNERGCVRCLYSIPIIRDVRRYMLCVAERRSKPDEGMFTDCNVRPGHRPWV